MVVPCDSVHKYHAPPVLLPVFLVLGFVWYGAYRGAALQWLTCKLLLSMDANAAPSLYSVSHASARLIRYSRARTRAFRASEVGAKPFFASLCFYERSCSQVQTTWREM